MADTTMDSLFARTVTAAFTEQQCCIEAVKKLFILHIQRYVPQGLVACSIRGTGYNSAVQVDHTTASVNTAVG